MSDANVVKLLQPGSFADPLTEVLRNGARALLAQAIEAEVAEFLTKYADLKTAAGLRRVVRHGHLPEREVMTGIGLVGVRQPRVRDRGAADDADRIVIMRDGRIEQVGAPAEVYQRPVSRFVAGFLGASNFLRGRVVDAATDSVLVEVPRGPIVSVAASRPVGSAVTVALRPEAVSIEVPGAMSESW